MKLIKISTDHYVITNDSEIKVGDYITDNYRVWQWRDDCSLLGRMKVTHSTQPFDDTSIPTSTGHIPVFHNIKQLSLLEVKGLIGEVDTEKKAEDWFESQGYSVYNHYNTMPSFIDGYNKCLEDNKDNKYTEDDLSKAIKMAQETVLADLRFEDREHRYDKHKIIKSLESKSEWQVEFTEQEKLKLK